MRHATSARSILIETFPTFITLPVEQQKAIIVAVLHFAEQTQTTTAGAVKSIADVLKLVNSPIALLCGNPDAWARKVARGEASYAVIGADDEIDTTSHLRIV